MTPLKGKPVATFRRGVFPNREDMMKICEQFAAQGFIAGQWSEIEHQGGGICRHYVITVQPRVQS